MWHPHKEALDFVLEGINASFVNPLHEFLLNKIFSSLNFNMAETRLLNHYVSQMFIIVAFFVDETIAMIRIEDISYSVIVYHYINV